MNFVCEYSCLKMSVARVPKKRRCTAHLVTDNKSSFSCTFNLEYLHNRAISLLNAPHNLRTNIRLKLNLECDMSYLLVNFERVLARLLQKRLVRHASDLRPTLRILGGRGVRENTLAHEITSQLLRSSGGYRSSRAVSFEPVCNTRLRVIEKQGVNPK